MRKRSGLVVLLAASALAGCGSARHGRSPLVKADFSEAAGSPVLEIAPHGVTLRFVPSAAFAIGIVLRNRAHAAVTIVDVRSPEPTKSLVHQIGTRLLAWNPPACTRARPCLGAGFVRAPYKAVRPAPLRVGAGRGAAVQLNFRLGACATVPSASPVEPRDVTILYRYGHGAVRSELLPLGAAAVRLRMPVPADCRHRPQSVISVSGPVVGSSDWTVPGSSGDRCTVGRVLTFRSRLFLVPQHPAMRVLIRLPRLDGPGLYRTLRRPASSRGPAQVVVAVDDASGRETFRSATSVVTVTRLTATSAGGRFHATFAAAGATPLRAYGAWRCTTG